MSVEFYLILRSQVRVSVCLTGVQVSTVGIYREGPCLGNLQKILHLGTLSVLYASPGLNPPSPVDSDNEGPGTLHGRDCRFDTLTHGTSGPRERQG